MIKGVAAAAPKPVFGSIFDMIGTSITDQNTKWVLPPEASASSAFMTDGYFTHFRQLSKQRVNMPLANDFGVSGYTFADILANTLGPCLRSGARYTCLEGGSNDLTNADPEISSFASMKRNWLNIVTRLIQAGRTVVVIPIPPRAGATLTTAQRNVQMQFTNWQREFCWGNSGLVYVDYLGYWLDQTSSSSVPLAGMVKTDNLHPTAIGAYWMGKAMHDVLTPLLPPQPTIITANADIYDATNNPTGSLIFSGSTNYALQASTGGTATAGTNLTFVNNGLAQGSTLVRATSSATCTVTLSKQNPRTDAGRASGERQVIQIAASQGGSADDVYNFRYTPAIGNVAEGDWFYAEASIETTAAPTNCNAIELYLLETATPVNQTAVDGSFNSSLAGVLPAVTDYRVFRTPPIRRQAGASALQCNVRFRFKTDVGAAGVTAAIGDFVVRKMPA